MSDKPKNLDDIDRFWDLNSLLPKKRPVTPSHRSINTDTVEITVPEESARDAGVPVPPQNAVRPRGELTMRARAEEYRSHPLDPYLIYAPESRLIKRVEVSKWDTKFNFYENFRTDAKRLWSRTASECEHVPFFAYVPQYSQLKYAQLKWYLWWRENVRRGVYLKSDFCYILLYIYEIINCPDLIEPSEGVKLLCDIWLAYRTEHKRIDSYMCEWLCDYCLINKLSCPTARLETILGEVAALASLKEFYMETASKSAASGVLMHMSTYDFRKSRYVTSDNVSVFSSHISGAFDRVWNEILSKSDTSDGAKEFRIERTAYEGALCVYDMKRSLAIEYVSFSRSPKFRFTVTDIIKYSENKVRMALGIKSRLKVEGLSDDIRACIDRYFAENLPAPKKTHPTKNEENVYTENEYDKLYEPVKSEFSIENAIKIEKDSWETTEILTSAFEEIPEPEPVPEVTSDIPEPMQTNEFGDEFAELIGALDEVCVSALTNLSRGDSTALTGAANSAGILADALADRINERAFDIIGDSIIEPCGGGYRLIADYEGDLRKWLK